MSETLKLSAPSDREIAMTRVFNAPRRLVFEAFIKPDLLKRWLLGPPGWEMVVCEVATKVGDRYRYEWRNTASGKQFGTGGICREFVAPERVVCSEMMDGYNSESVNTTTFQEHEGKTTVVLTMLFESREARDMALKSGMERGVAASYDLLADLLRETERVASAS